MQEERNDEERISLRSLKASVSLKERLAETPLETPNRWFSSKLENIDKTDNLDNLDNIDNIVTKKLHNSDDLVVTRELPDLAELGKEIEQSDKLYDFYMNSPLTKYIQTNPPRESVAFIMGYFDWALKQNPELPNIALSISSMAVAAYLQKGSASVRMALSRLVRVGILRRVKTGNSSLQTASIYELGVTDE